MDIISMAQQARPKPSGQMELLRAQFTALSSVVKIMPSSSSSLPKSSGLVSVTCLPRDTLIVTSRVFWHSARAETNRRLSTSGPVVSSHYLSAGAWRLASTSRYDMQQMIRRKYLNSPGALFLALAISLLPPGIVLFHSDWPPFSWEH